MTKPVKVSGKIFFPQFMSTFNTHFVEDNTKYECTIGCISDVAQKKLQDELGIKPKNKELMENFFCAKSKFLFEAVDEDGNPIDVKEIGTGTEVVVVVSSYSHRMSKQHGNAPSIKKIIVTKLVKWKTEENIEQDVEWDPVL